MRGASLGKPQVESFEAEGRTCLAHPLYPVLVLPPSPEKGPQIWNVIRDKSGYRTSLGLGTSPRLGEPA